MMKFPNILENNIHVPKPPTRYGCRSKQKEIVAVLHISKRFRRIAPWFGWELWRYWVWTHNNIYPLVICYIAIEHGPFIVDIPIKMVIFHGYVSLPEGIFIMIFYLAAHSHGQYKIPWANWQFSWSGSYVPIHYNILSTHPVGVSTSVHDSFKKHPTGEILRVIYHLSTIPSLSY